MPAFVLNDESKVNSYGFRVLNTGIDLRRFKTNPVMLNQHYNSISYVLGYWENIRIDGSKLIADSKFDLEDEATKSVAGKVDRGFIKSCSMGITFNREYMKANPDGAYILEKCELMEASIVAVPSNANALTLYAETGELLEEKEIKLSLQNLKTDIKITKENNMEKFILSPAALTALGLQNADDATAVSTAIGKLIANYDAAKLAHTALQAESDNRVKAQAEVLVNGAIAEGKLSADMKDEFIQMAIATPALATKVIAGMPGKKSLAGTVNNKEAGAVKSDEDFQKLSLTEQLEFKTERPDEYKKIFA